MRILERQRIRRRMTTAQWAAENPVLLDGEPGWDTVLKIRKIGDGETQWTALTEPGSGGGGGGGGWTAVDATESTKGIAELATQAETNTGSDDARIVTPLKFQTRLAAYAQPLDTDLSNIAALTTAAYGRGLLTLADQAALMTALLVATTSAQGIVELATNAEAQTGVDTARAVTPAGLKAAIDDAKAAILGAGVPGALDTLDELAAALGDDANFAATVTTSLSNKQPLDATLTALAGLASSANKLPYFTGTDTFSTTDLSAFVRTILDDADASTVLSTLGVSAFAKTLLDDADAPTARGTLGLGTAAVANTGTASGEVALLGAGGRYAIDRLASGTPDGTKFLRDDGVLAVPAGGGGGWTAVDATETVKGIAEVATQAETNTGTDDARMVTPLKMQTRMAAYAQPVDTDLTAIAALVSAANKIPYATGSGTWSLTDFTAYGRTIAALADAPALMAQLTAATTTAQGIVELATSAETTTGADTARAVTPAGVQAVRDLLEPLLRVRNDQTGTTYTFVLADAIKAVTFGNAAATLVTIPTNASVAMPVDTKIPVAQFGAGQVTFVGAGGVTINTRGGGLKLAGQWAVGELWKTATDTWLLTGDITG